VQKYLPISLGLFLTGVFLCFGFVLPITLGFLLEFNVWLGVAPTLRLSEWMSFATILPWCSASPSRPASHAFLERVASSRLPISGPSERSRSCDHDRGGGSHAWPGPFSMTLLAVPMIMLYELGILLVGSSKKRVLAGPSHSPARGTLAIERPRPYLSCGRGTSRPDPSSGQPRNLVWSGEGHGTRYHWIDRAGHRGNGRRPDLDRACRPHRRRAGNRFAGSGRSSVIPQDPGRQARRRSRHTDTAG